MKSSMANVSYSLTCDSRREFVSSQIEDQNSLKIPVEVP